MPNIGGILPRAFAGGAPNSVTKSGIAGGQGGNAFEDFPPGDFEVAEIRIWGGFFIDAVQLIYRNRQNPGNTIEGPKHGGGGGTLNEPLGLDRQLQPGEYIIAISGRCGNFVDSLQIQTNFHLYNRCGGQGGANDYEFQGDQGDELVGFHGKCGNYVDALGVLYRTRQQ